MSPSKNLRVTLVGRESVVLRRTNYLAREASIYRLCDTIVKIFTECHYKLTSATRHDHAALSVRLVVLPRPSIGPNTDLSP